jgi:hypothetical protein
MYVTHRQSIFENMVHKISKYAMQKMLNHIQMDSDRSCTGYFKKTYGLPCRHDIRKHKVVNVALPLELVHKQWILRWPNNMMLKTLSMNNCHLHVRAI